MKKILLITITGFLSMAVLAQGKSGNKGKSKNNPATEQTDNPGKSGDKVKDKGKNKDKKNDKAQNDEHDRKVWDGIGDNSCMKPSKNQPAKVRAAFQRDYPNTINVRWTKCRGDWTATFSGSLFRSTAVYHANGDRRDTRTPVTRDNIPRRILDEIFKKRPDTRLDEAVKIEVPNAVKEIFRIKNIFDGKTEFEYYDSDGNKVQYDY
jgi:hypothetical protein